LRSLVPSHFTGERVPRLAYHLVKPVFERLIHTEATVGDSAGPFKVLPAALRRPVLRGAVHEFLDI
jgi:hypothetical protein